MQKKILVVEDTDDTRHLMKVILEMCGYAVLEAVDGSEAVKSVIEQNPDLILMDMSMPVMDGLTATRIIRGMENKTELPIIAVTAHGNFFYKQAIEAGCNSLIPKPVDFDTLQPAIEQFFA